MTDAPSPDWAELRRLAEAAADCDDMGGVWAYGAWSEKSNDAVVIAATKYQDVDLKPLTGSVEYEPGEIHFEPIAHCEDDLRGITRAAYIAAANPATILALLDERAALIARAEKAEAEAKALREALRPFAREAERWYHVADARFIGGGDMTVGDLRRARALTGGDHG